MTQLPSNVAIDSSPSPLGYEAPAGNQRFPLIDSLRGVAAASVFLFHFADGGLRVHGPIGDIFDHGDFGVVLFFLISGFLLYRPFVVARLPGGKSIGVRSFYLRRVLRIVPAYWTALTILAIYPGLVSFGTRWWQLYAFGQIYGPNTRFAGIGPAWSLCIEVSFYLVLPLYAYMIGTLLKRCPGRNQWRWELLVLAILAFASLAFNRTLHSSGSEQNLEFTLPGTFYLFAIGMALAVASARWQDSRVPELIRRWSTLIWLTALALYLAISLTVSSARLGSVNPVWALLALMILLPATTASDGPVARVLSSRALTSLGLISYAFYLWHQNLIDLLARHIHSNLALFVASLLLTLAIASVSYFGVESPFLRLKARLARRAS
jgi:peptidoglycan/LPS O-acetylase OafA/YrhL